MQSFEDTHPNLVDAMDTAYLNLYPVVINPGTTDLACRIYRPSRSNFPARMAVRPSIGESFYHALCFAFPWPSLPR